MSGSDIAWMPEFDPATGIFALPLWLAGALLVVIAIFAIRTIVRAGVSPVVAALPQYALVALAIVIAWNFLDHSVKRDSAEVRRLLEARATTLTAQAIAPGSALACLDGIAGETVENACEKALFANPQTVASAVSYVGAQLALLSDASDLVKSRDQLGEAINDLRKAAESDRFGIVAHVLATRHGCTADKCDAFRHLSDPTQVIARLNDNSFAQSIARYAAVWPVNGATPVASNPLPAEKPTTTSAIAPSNWNFPSAASIPPVSIMNNEPGGPPAGIAPAEPPPPAAAARKPAPPTPRRNPASAQASPLPAPRVLPSAIPPPAPSAPSTTSAPTPPAPQ